MAICLGRLTQHFQTHPFEWQESPLVSKCSNTSQIPVDISTILISQVVAPGASLGHLRRGGPAPRLLGRRGGGLRGLRGARRQRHGLHGLLRSCGDQHHNHHGGGKTTGGGLGGKGQRGLGSVVFFLKSVENTISFGWQLQELFLKGKPAGLVCVFWKKTRNSNKYAVSRWGFDQETWNVMVSCRICGWEWRATQLLLFLWRLLESWTYREYFSNKNYGGTMVVLMLFIPPIILFTFTIIYGKFIHIYTTNW